MHTNGKIFDFNIFRRQGDFSRSIYSGDISLKQANDRQEEIEYTLRNLEGYKPSQNKIKPESRQNVTK